MFLELRRRTWTRPGSPLPHCRPRCAPPPLHRTFFRWVLLSSFDIRPMALHFIVSARLSSFLSSTLLSKNASPFCYRTKIRQHGHRMVNSKRSRTMGLLIMRAEPSNDHSASSSSSSNGVTPPSSDATPFHTSNDQNDLKRQVRLRSVNESRDSP